MDFQTLRLIILVIIINSILLNMEPPLDTEDLALEG